MRRIIIPIAVAATLTACGGSSTSLADVSAAMHARSVQTPAALVQATANRESACADTEQLTKSGDASPKGRYVCVLFPGERIIYGDTVSDLENAG